MQGEATVVGTKTAPGRGCTERGWDDWKWVTIPPPCVGEFGGHRAALPEGVLMEPVELNLPGETSMVLLALLLSLTVTGKEKHFPHTVLDLGGGWGYVQSVQEQFVLEYS